MTEIETFASQTILFEPDAPSFEFDTRLGRRILDHVNSRSILYIVQRRLTMSRRVTCQGKLEMHEKVHYSIHELVLYALVRRVILFMGKTMLRAQDYRTNCNCKSKKKNKGTRTFYKLPDEFFWFLRSFAFLSYSTSPCLLSKRTKTLGTTISARDQKHGSFRFANDQCKPIKIFSVTIGQTTRGVRILILTRKQ